MIRAAALALLLALGAGAEEAVLAPRSALSMPRPDTVDRFAVLTGIPVEDPWTRVVEDVARPRNAPVVRFAGDDPSAARADLAAIAPGTVAVVVKPEAFDVDFVYRLLELAAGLDSDFALDFRFSIVTARTPEEALALLERERRVTADRTLVPRRIVDFGPSEADLDMEGGQEWLAGWERELARHLKVSEAEVKRLEKAGILQFWGHGRPEGIAGSVDVDQLGGVDLFPAVAFGGPIYTGVTNGWYEGPVSAAPRQRRVTPVERAFALALISRGATAVFGATDPGHGVTAMQEMEAMAGRGLSLAETHKTVADASLLFLRSTPLKLPRIGEGRVAPSRDWGDTLARGALSRVAFGDPDYRPFTGSGDSQKQEIERLDNGLRVKVTVLDARLRATLSDVFQYGFGRKDALLNARVLTQVEWPDDMPLPVRLRVLDARSGGREIRVGPALAAVELWGSRRRVHVQLDLPAQSLAAGSELRFLLRTGAAGEDQDRETLFDAARSRADEIGERRAGTPLEPARWALYDGTAGVALFQMNLFRATSDGTQSARARALLDEIVAAAEPDGAAARWTDAWFLPDGTPAWLSRDGLHSGTAGIGSVLLEGFRMFSDRRYLEAALAAGARIEGAARRGEGIATWGDDTTVAGGAAGILLFLIDLAETSGEAKWLALAAEAGAGLEAAKIESGERVHWRAQGSLPRSWTGLSHGTAGIAVALMRLGEATRDDRWQALAERAALWVADAAVRDRDALLWPAVTGEGDAAPVTGAGYGTAGIVRLFVRLCIRTKDPRWLELAKSGGLGVRRALEQAAERPFERADYEAGGAGIGEMCLDLFELTRDGAWLDDARRIADTLRNQAGPAPGRWSRAPETPSLSIPYDGDGLFPGAAGIGQFFLRLATIDMEFGKRPRGLLERR